MSTRNEWKNGGLVKEAELPEKVWLCIEWRNGEVRASNLPAGPRHCYFVGTPKHLPRCGFVHPKVVVDEVLGEVTE